MKKLLLSLVLSSSMLHCSSAFAMNLDDDEQPSILLAYSPALLADPHEVFEAAKFPSVKSFKHRTATGLIRVGPGEDFVGETYYSISSSQYAPVPISQENHQLLSNYYIDAHVHFERIPGSAGKRKATLTVRENTEHERSINLFLSVITSHS